MVTLPTPSPNPPLPTHPHSCPANSLDANPQVHPRKVHEAGETQFPSSRMKLCVGLTHDSGSPPGQLTYAQSLFPQERL